MALVYGVLELRFFFDFTIIPFPEFKQGVLVIPVTLKPAAFPSQP